MADHRNSSEPRFTIDLDQAIRLEMPRTADTLCPKGFEGTRGRGNWYLRTPGGRPIATPAYEDGLLFVGGGYGSYEFYAFDASSGEVAWKMKTSDDGPTAAVVERGFVAFNTESCTVIVCEARTGRVVWEEWLGDPLMSQPAIVGDRLFIAYPARKSKPMIRPGMTLAEKKAAVDAARGRYQVEPFQHRILCANLYTGEHLWEQEISGDVITSPVIDGDQVFVTCLDGISYCFNVSDGSVAWRKENQGTSAPLIVNGRVVMTEKETRGGKIYEHLRRARRATGVYHERDRVHARESPYLSRRSSGGSSIKEAVAIELDSSVGFSSAPPSAKLYAASEHLGVGSVSGTWAFQGSRTAYRRGRLFSSQGKHVCCLKDEDQSVAWESEVKGSRVDPEDQVFLPPSMGREYLYLTSLAGHALSLSQGTGDVGFLYTVDRPICFQPCLAGGRMYFGTAHGELICIDTGSDDADGWYMWGGNAQHNKLT